MWIHRIHDHDGDGRTRRLALWLRLADGVGLDREEVASCRSVLPGVRFACDAYVDARARAARSWRRWRRRSPSSSRRTSCRGASLAWEKHYPWVERGDARVLPLARAARPARLRGGHRLRGRATRRRCDDAGARAWPRSSARRRSSGTCWTARTQPTSSRAGARRGPAPRDLRREQAPPRAEGAAPLRPEASQYMLLYPERGLELNATAADVHRSAARASGPSTRSWSELAQKYGRPARHAVEKRSDGLPRGRCADRGLVAVTVASSDALRAVHAGRRADLPVPAPLRVLLEPARLRRHGRELDTATWRRVFARGRGRSASCRCNLTGGEPLVRDDLEALVAEARAPRALHEPDHQRHPAPPRAARATRASRAGQRADLDPGHRRAAALGRIAGRRLPSTRKLEVARLGQGARPPADAQRRAAPRQHRPRRRRSWRWRSGSAPTGSSWRTRSTSAGRSPNRDALLPTREQLERARAVAAAARERLRGQDGGAVRARPTTTRTCRRPAWTAGRRRLHRRHARRARCCRVTPAHTLPGLDVRRTCASVRSARSGASRPAFKPFAARAGCPSRAGAATGAGSTSAAAAARPFT